MTRPTDVLRAEHDVILTALDLLESAARQPGVDDGWWAEIATWFGDVADRLHHGKEERALFPALVGAGVPNEGGPIGVMLEEHGEGRALVRRMAAGGPVAPGAARQFVRLLRHHIAKENDVLFPLADELLDEDAQRRVGRMCDAITADGGAEASIVRAEAWLTALATALAAGPMRAA
jgi:hemerythrin-like domain-containing protein